MLTSFLCRNVREAQQAVEDARYEEEELEEQRRRLLKQQEAKMVLIEEIKRDMEQAELDKAEGSDGDLPDDGDDDDEDEEIEAWKLREMRRLKRDQLERDEREQVEAEIARRRHMTDAEILDENERLGLNQQQEKPAMKFLQKYYHKGSFYIDEDDPLFQRNFNEATLQDRTTDRVSCIQFSTSPLTVLQLLLPTVMQVKKFGLKGQTKCQSHRTSLSCVHLNRSWQTHLQRRHTPECRRHVITS